MNRDHEQGPPKRRRSGGARPKRSTKATEAAMLPVTEPAGALATQQERPQSYLERAMAWHKGYPALAGGALGVVGVLLSVFRMFRPRRRRRPWWVRLVTR